MVLGVIYLQKRPRKKLINEVLNALNDRMFAGGIFCDLKKAFDCVNYDILLSKLEFYGIVGKANALVKSYLNDRYQRVVVNDWHTHSEWRKVKNGVPRDRSWDLYYFIIYK
jgi:hypothetical protein